MFDPYHKWLGIRDPQRPPNHYRLLGVEMFEADVDVIQSAADRQMAHVRQFQSGEYADISQRLLNEIAQAKLCLLVADSRRAYEQSQQTQVTGPPIDERAPSLGIETKQNTISSRVQRKNNSGIAWAAGAILTLAAIALAIFQPWRNGSGEEMAISPVTPQPKTSATGDNAANPTDTSSLNANSNPPATPTESPSTPPGEIIESGRDTPTDSNESTSPSTVPTNDSLGSSQETTDSVGSKPQPERIPPWRSTREIRRPSRIAFTHPAAQCLNALRARDLESARKSVERVEANAASPIASDVAARLSMITDQVEAFWSSYKTGLSQLQPGDELVVDGTPIKVDGIEGENITVSCGGEEHTIRSTTAQIPAQYAVSISEFGSQQSPFNESANAIFLSLDAKGDLDAAAQRFERVKAAGLQTDLLAGVMQEVPEQLVVAKPSDNEQTQETVDGFPKPVPEKAKLEAAEKLINELFSAQIRDRTPQGREALATAMLQQAIETNDDSAAQFLLLRKSTQIAVSAGNAELGWKALDILSSTFEVDKHQLRRDALVALAKKTRGKSLIVQTIRQCLPSVNEAVLSDRYTEAEQMAKTLVGLAKKTRDTTFIKNIQTLPIDVAATHKRYRELQTAIEALKSNPDDTKLRNEVGDFTCLSKGDFKAGIPILAGGDSELAALAKKELEETGVPEDLQNADDWWDLADTEKGSRQRYARRHAGDLYRRILPKLSGLHEKRVQTRIQSIAGNPLVKLSNDIVPGDLFGPNTRFDIVWKNVQTSAQHKNQLEFKPDGTYRRWTDKSEVTGTWRLDNNIVSAKTTATANRIEQYKFINPNEFVATSTRIVNGRIPNEPTDQGIGKRSR